MAPVTIINKVHVVSDGSRESLSRNAGQFSMTGAFKTKLSVFMERISSKREILGGD
jgi:hypothetical protein